MSLDFFWWIFYLVNVFSNIMTDNRNSGNYNDSQPYVVGILSPSTTLYIDQVPNNREISPPTDLNLRRKNTNSFQITSVTVQGSRRNDDLDDSADDLDESHTDDLSSDILDSSRADNEGYHSEDSVQIADDLSPCGPIIFAQIPSRDPNMNLSLGVTPTYAAIGPTVVAGGVTMMTSKSESPISAQVPIMNPLPDNWQRRFKVVKIMSSEPFRRGRWLCMDFKDPPTNVTCESRSDNNGTDTPPTIQITNCDAESLTTEMLASGNFAQVYEIPINQTFSGNFVMGNHQQMYGIILPQSDHLQPVTLVQDVSLQTTNKNFNNLVNSHSILLEKVGVQDPAFQSASQRRVQTIISNDVNQSPPPSVSANNNITNNNNNNNIINNNNNGEDISNIHSQAVLNHFDGSTAACTPDIKINPEDNQTFGITSNTVDQPVPIENAGTEQPESFSSLASELHRTSIPSQPIPNVPLVINSNGLSCSPPLQTEVFLPSQPPMIPATDIALSNNVATNTVVPPPISLVADINSATSTGGNTVAIDNKIEQAMDLVKSHLMFAVREEVEVLKEKITELLERISQLEHENDILRANASAETLKQLNSQSHKKNASGGNTGKPQAVATVPPST